MTLHWGRPCKCYSQGPLAPQMPFPEGVKSVQRGVNRFIPLPFGPKARFGRSLGKGQGNRVSCAARMQASWGSGSRFSLLGTVREERRPCAELCSSGHLLASAAMVPFPSTAATDNWRRDLGGSTGLALSLDLGQQLHPSYRDESQARAELFFP